MTKPTLWRRLFAWARRGGEERRRPQAEADVLRRINELNQETTRLRKQTAAQLSGLAELTRERSANGSG